MEKISGIVRGNSRVAGPDSKSAGAARPGAPTMGRNVGESTVMPSKMGSTASRAVALHNGLEGVKKANVEARMISQMADEFFMSRSRAAMEDVAQDMSAIDAPPAEVEGVQVPQSYTPRGSYVDVRA
ncbi:MAG TPA: hypothetical protein PKC28_12865 [Bdellovibrionales bacterium]|nr:hypothetical protein [Bdellovibrionales bacterium]